MTTTDPALPGHASRPAHRDGNVLRWLTAHTASLVGDSVYFVALGWSAQKAAGPAEVGLVMAAGALPRALLMLVGGVVADRFDPRRVILGSDVLRCLLILSVAAGIALSAPALWMLVAVALVFGAVDALFVPAIGALPPRITGPGQLARVSGMRSLSMRLSQIAGPPIGGLAMGLGGAAAAFTVAGLLFALSLPFLSTMRVRPLEKPGGEQPENGTVRQDLLDGLRYIRRHRLVGPLVVVGALCELGLVGTLNVGMILLNAERGWGPSGYGWIVSGFGAGAAAGAALLSVVGRLPRAGLLLAGTLLVSSAGAVSIALVPALWIAVAMALVTGLCAGTFGGVNNALVQAATDPAYLGRVTSVVMLAMVGLAPLGYPLVGAAIGAWGSAPVFVGCGAFACLGVAVVLASGAVRRAELPRAH
ncbi:MULTISPECIES: MFS transporter [Streptomyces]|uniref:MFS transporter n=1 Tax=Streptomyces glycanivorans TaxID=3033808 RepID=A0ABY9JLF3_9ACTN|nr:MULTISPECIES: MFS transporter [unclassified Streptomyces]WSQ81879.1 MFS transporter [Streptomyces sp. NBC_01213]TXS12032.1 MFS transporter [Streptomyces sp. wa22]WLQ68523.1 MFS transporter [Streptomyces sp. Alt3]WSR04788.1 MFS transporter [Streptomyces sp. NBC_01208]WSR52599.1 MFS transporter [Streptomyces sp. NBC_01201]